MNEIFSFLRRHKFKTGVYDTELTCFYDAVVHGAVGYRESAHAFHGETREEFDTLNEHLQKELGDRSKRPLWFHV